MDVENIMNLLDDENDEPVVVAEGASIEEVREAREKQKALREKQQLLQFFMNNDFYQSIYLIIFNLLINIEK